MKLSIVIPAYNEERRLGDSLDQYLDYFSPRYGMAYEIVVVVNGSRDHTEQVARARMEGHPQVKVLVDAGRIGKGGAVMMGFRAAQGELIGFTDADASTPPEAFDDLARNIGDAGAIIGSRWFPESRVFPPQPLKRRIASRMFNFLVRKLFKVKIRDTQCGAKILKRDAVQDVLPDIGITHWAFDVDLLFKLRRAGHRIIEWPTTWRDAGGSQLHVGRASLEMFIAIVRLRLLYSPFRFVVSLYDVTLGRWTHRRAGR